MINNRQNGRRRGRGGGNRSPNNAPNPGNRQDNRSRGNASQLLEKYKALARDAQLAGDRVQTEYYLQFADHYFRVLNEHRVRFEEQRRQQGGYADDEDGEDEAMNAAEGEGHEQEEREEREDRREREPRFDRNGDGRGRGRRQGRREQAEAAEEGEGEERISLESLPPAIAVVDDEEGPRAPRRRTRRPRDNDEAEIAPAA